MRHVNANSAVILGLFIAGLGTQIAGIHSWDEAFSPAFVGGTLMTLGAILRAYTAVAPAKAE